MIGTIEIFRAPSTDELIFELQQRMELARSREEIARLKRENAELRTQNRHLRSQIRHAIARPNTRGRQEDSKSSMSVHGFKLPPSLAHFTPSIERSQAMVDLGDDWDGEGSLGYDEETWRRAVEIAVGSARRFVLTRDERVPAPAITKGPEGSVVILWRWGSKQLMIDVPGDAEEPVTYHGYDRENHHPETKGTLDLVADNGWVLSWLSS